MRITTAAFCVAMVGCSSEPAAVPAGAEACEINGTYSVVAMKQSGNCDAVYPQLQLTNTLTFSKTSKGAQLVIAGIPNAIDVTVDACKVTGAIVTTLRDGDAGASKQGTIQLSYAFGASGFTGASTQSLPAVVDAQGVPRAACTITTKDEGTRL